MSADEFDEDIMTDADLEAVLDSLTANGDGEVSELLKIMNENQLISWDEAERIMGDLDDTPIKSSLPPQTRPSEPDNETNVDDVIRKLLNNDPKLTQVNLNNMKRTPVPQIKRIIEAMKQNSHVEKISLANMGLYTHDIENLIELVAMNENLRHINLETNYLGGEFFEKLFQAALENQTLEEVKAVNQGVSFPTTSEREIIKAITKNRGLLKVSINLRLPEGRHKIENTTIRNQEIRRALRRQQRAEEEAAAASAAPKEEPKKPEPKAVPKPVPKPAPPPPEPEPPAAPVSEAKKVYRRQSMTIPKEDGVAPTLPSPVAAAAKPPVAPPKKSILSKAESTDKSDSEKKPLAPTSPKKKFGESEVPEKKPLGVFPRSKLNSTSSKKSSDDERVSKPTSTANSTNPSDAEKNVSASEGEGKPKKKIIKKKIIVKKVVKKKKAPGAAATEDGAVESASGATESEREEETTKIEKPKPVPPPTLPKTKTFASSRYGNL